MKKLTWFVVIAASIVLGAAGVVGIDALGSDNSSSGGTTTVIQKSDPPSSQPVASSSSAADVADLFSRVRPSIVQINASSTRNTSAGIGSGVVLDKDGHILTNNHVVSGFDQIDVQLADGSAASAAVVGTDPGSDLAVIKVDMPGDKLTPATLGDSSKVRVGEFVIAIGNPFGIEGTVTEGIVSGLGRTLSGGSGRPLRQLIQSDAAINPGNSGGALFNARGEVIGITSAIENPSGERVFVGIGYAVPINTAQRFLPDMLAGKPVAHPRLGVGLQNLTPAVAKTLNLSVEQGVLLTQVEPNSAAAKAGLKGGAGGRTGAVGDVVIQIDNKEIKTYDDLADYIDSKNVGDKVTVKYVRDGKEATVQVTLEAWTQTAATS